MKVSLNIFTNIVYIFSCIGNNGLPLKPPYYQRSKSFVKFLKGKNKKGFVGCVKKEGHKSVGNHSFSTYAKFFKKLTFLTPDKHTHVCVSGDKKC